MPITTPHAQLPAHVRMLLDLAALRPDPEAVARCRELIDNDEVDWSAFVDAAGRHKILPLVSKHINHHRLDRGGSGDGSQGVPYYWLYSYVYLANKARNAYIAEEFSRVLGALDAAGVRHAVRKGFVLAEHAYHDIGSRRINDLDVLVDRVDASAAHKVLLSLGYIQGKISRDSDEVVPFDRETQIFWRANLSNQLPYVKPGGREDVPVLNVDLCHSIFQRKSTAEVRTADLLDRAVRMPLCGGEASALDPEDHLLDLCAHLHKEATGILFVKEGVDLQLSKFLDVAVTCAARPAEAWPAFVERVKACGAQEIVYYSLHFAAELFSDSVPADVLGQLRPADLSYLDAFGEFDGREQHWDLGFPERLFAFERRHAGGESAVPGVRA
ncbi:nucleotidyltransferase family protein [Streptomyces sp. NPDC050287]|uniref:nucleotidyltransferase family protein n=1 Tax=Streptomyces sp. NPDC050287 TaxID=3365608 RepID=UPI0037A84BE4